ncbi:GNAT family N-acetyltransferase [Aureibacter tunicatorum]|uniref:GNAT family N-acyltransferase n=1 Tax=Aureibacter tunicatorum TaxID=866807 RepID=A0AAE4BS10_9BACT|nr:GNAT family N-acetyltransferase [Aureibacter tunicatorum]MDR6239261.1 putative GNAT family N-acyltransferase [Aureibacter tunicatorum]BDD04814.1 GNAT family N-acetyltransferase [Aureibacter tunicatorum]
MITVRKVATAEETIEAIKVREAVFVEELKIPFENEVDEYEKASEHFVAFDGSNPCGTARWRFGEEGIVLEKFAVINSYRHKGVGTELLHAILDDIANNPYTQGTKIILYCNKDSVQLYQKFGFVKSNGVSRHENMEMLELSN